jgi:ABC-type multidrug transport system fused ATPase/permease subunit
LYGSSTLLVIAHRLSTIITSSDRIVVLEDGVVKEIGTFYELKENKNSALNSLLSAFNDN